MSLSLSSSLVGKFRFIASPLLSVLWVPTLYTFLSSLAVIVAIWEVGDKTLDERETLPTTEEHFDFIVVGAGSAGGVVANRLSKHYSVLLLEAGGEPHPLQQIPGFGLFLLNYPEIDWMHRTVPQKHSCLNSVNQQSSWSAGRGLGGTGNLNYLIHLRGHKLDFDFWAKITGDSSWNWEGVLPYFKSYEDYGEEGDLPSTYHYTTRYHGYGGTLRIEDPDYIGLGPEFVKAGEELGYGAVDLNGEYTEGFDVEKFPIKNGVRQATYAAFIQPIRKRKNLTIRKFSHVTRVLFKDENVAYGVEYDRYGEKRVAFSSKEVILSAGTMTTPRILMLSGIGPADHLQEWGIPLRVDLPVGHGLQDHASAFLGPFFINQPRSIQLERDVNPGAIVQWFVSGKGVLSSPGCHAAGIISSSHTKALGINWPDIVLYLFGFSVNRTFGAILSHLYGLKLDEMEKYFKHAIDKESLFLAVMGARPKSKGYIKLGGTSAYDKPVIDPNYLNDPGNVDIEVMVDGIKKALYLMENTTTFGRDLGTRYTEERLPGCEHLAFRSDAYWECLSRRFTVTLHHPVGTCGMGRVVDTKLRVYGTKGLRVIDASIQPEIVVSNTQASTIMIGEKGSSIVLEYWNNADRENEIHQDYASYSNKKEVYTVDMKNTTNIPS